MAGGTRRIHNMPGDASTLHDAGVKARCAIGPLNLGRREAPYGKEDGDLAAEEEPRMSRRYHASVP